MAIKVKDIDRWVAAGIIDHEQRQKIVADLQNVSAERASVGWITALSLIGAILLGIAAVMFISANWDELSRAQKIVLAVISTFGCFAGGYFLSFLKQTYTRSGKVLMFLSALLFGGTLALISQAYHLSGPLAGFFLLWLIGVFPLAYLFRIYATLYLFIGLVFLVFASFLTGATTMDEQLLEGMVMLVPLMVIIGLLLFGVGGLHRLFPEWESYGSAYQRTGLRLSVFFLFWMTFGEFLEEIGDSTLEFFDEYPAQNISMILVALLAALAMTTALFYQKLPRSQKGLQGGLFGTLLISMLVFVFFFVSQQSESRIQAEQLLPFTLFFNALFVVIILAMLKDSYQRSDLRLLNYALLISGAFIFGKYIQLFNDLLQGSAFFFVSGGVFLGVGFLLEKYRHHLKKQWIKN